MKIGIANLVMPVLTIIFLIVGSIGLFIEADRERNDSDTPIDFSGLSEAMAIVFLCMTLLFIPPLIIYSYVISNGSKMKKDPKRKLNPGPFQLLIIFTGITLVAHSIFTIMLLTSLITGFELIILLPFTGPQVIIKSVSIMNLIRIAKSEKSSG